MPEPLVIIRSYSSRDLAEEDCRLLIDAGIDAYTGTYIRQRTVKVRVPTSQVEQALALLPPPAPDLLAPADPQKACAWCGCEQTRFASSPLVRSLVLGGMAFAAWLAIRRQFEAAALLGVGSIWLLFVKVIDDRLVCSNCGREWRARERAPEPEDEHEPRTENLEA